MSGKQELGQLQNICQNQEGDAVIYTLERRAQTEQLQANHNNFEARYMCFQYICGLVGLRTFLGNCAFTFKVESYRRR